MAARISKLQRLHAKKFGAKYPRKERENKLLSPEYISNDKQMTYSQAFAEKEGIAQAAVKDEPIDGFHLATEYNLRKKLPNYNSLLIYRIFRLMYGKADILGASIIDKEKKQYLGPLVGDIHFLLKIIFWQKFAK